MSDKEPLAADYVWHPRRAFSPLRPLRRFLSDQISRRLLKLAHRRNAPLRMALGALVGGVWFTFGLAAAIDAMDNSMRPPPPVQSSATTTPQNTTVRVIATGVCVFRSGRACDYAPPRPDDEKVFVAQTALALLTLFTLLFGFWTQFVGAVARAVRSIGVGHVVVTGDGWEPEALARNAARSRAVLLVRADVSPAEQDALGADGVDLIAGSPADRAVLRAADVRSADRVVAMSSSEPQNIAVAAAVRGERRRARPGDVVVRIGSSALRTFLSQNAKLRAADMISLSQISARLLTLTPDILAEAQARSQNRVHVALVGWGEASSAIAARVLRQYWAPAFGDPAITVYEKDAAGCEADFTARFPVARSEEAWKADITFVEFDWQAHRDPWAALRAAAPDRPSATAIVVSLADETDVLRCAAALAAKRPSDGVPIYVRETRDGAIGVALATDSGAKVIAYGGPADVLSSNALLDRSLDRAAQHLHTSYINTCVLNQNRETYERALRRRSKAATGVDAKSMETMLDAKTLSELRRKLVRSLLAQGRFQPEPDRPAQRPWEDVGEVYINANRTGADHAVIKLWALGWRVARRGERGELPNVDPQKIDVAFCECEHRRWMADMILTGYRCGARDDAQMMHPDLKAYADYPNDDVHAFRVDKDRDPWLEAPTIASEIFPQLFVRR